jgi:hypothetical protein
MAAKKQSVVTGDAAWVAYDFQRNIRRNALVANPKLRTASQVGSRHSRSGSGQPSHRCVNVLNVGHYAPPF